jgi:hypothetical protein
MLGQSYTVGANSDYNTLYLYGSGSPVSVTEGESTPVTVDGVEHTVLLVGTSSATSAYLEVDGNRKTVTKGSSYKYPGEFEVYIKDLYHSTKTGTFSSAELLLGAKTLHFENGQAARYGADDTTILGTKVYLSGTQGAGINSITIAQGHDTATGDYLKAGESYTERVLGGLVLDFVGTNPTLDSTTRESVLVDTDNSVSARVKFTSALAGTAGEKQIAFARDSDLIADANLKMLLANDANKTIHVKEGANAVVGDYIVVNDNDEGRIFEVVSIPAGTSANDKVTLRDVITAETFDFSTGLTNKTTTARTIGGAEYNAMVANTNADNALWTINLTWGAGSTTGYEGTQTTLFPRIKLKNGEWLAFLTQSTLNNGTTYSMPGQYLLTDYKTGLAFATTGANHSLNSIAYSMLFGNVNYTLNSTNASAYATATLSGIDTNYDGTVDCNFNTTFGPAVLIMEEKTLADSNGYGICIPLTTYTSGSTKMPGIGTPVSRDTVLSLTTLQSNTYKSQGITTYGTLVERDVSTGTNYAASVSYPDEQMYMDVYFKAPATTVTPGSSSAGGGTVLVVKDSQVDSIKDKNLLVIGGSCINSVARKIVDATATSPICGEDFTAKTNVGAGQYLIQAVESPYNAAKVAVLVAGYEASDTENAVAKLKENHATDVGTKSVYPQTTA